MRTNNPMSLLVTMLLGLFAIALPLHTSASDFYPVTEADKKFLSQIVDAVRRRDAAWIADHMIYPLSTVAGKETQLVKRKEEFTAVLRRELTDKVGAKIAEDAKKPLFKNWRGVMAGDGILWFSETRVGDRGPWRYMIFAIGSFAFQSGEGANPQGGANGKQPLRSIRARPAAAAPRGSS